MLSFMNKDGGCPGEEDRTVNGSSGSSAVDSTKAPQKKTKKYFSNTNKVEHDRVDFESNEPQKDGKKERKKERKKESKNWQGPATAAPKRRNMRENDFRLFIRIRYQGPLKSSIQNQLLSRINHGQLVPRNDID